MRKTSRCPLQSLILTASLSSRVYNLTKLIIRKVNVTFRWISLIVSTELKSARLSDQGPASTLTEPELRINNAACSPFHSTFLRPANCLLL